MRKNMLLRTNLMICLIIVIGFVTTAVISYCSNQGIFHKDIERVTDLTSQGIYHQIDAAFTKPLNISLTMANDTLLKGLLEQEQARLNDASYLDEMRRYLSAYREAYGYDSVFLVSADTKRYYHFNGLDRVLERGNEENEWFYQLLDSRDAYSIVIDNDEVKGAQNDITIFINCRMEDAEGNPTAVVGIGFRVTDLQMLLKSYEDEFGVHAYLVDEAGMVEVSTDRTGYEKVSLFDLCKFPQLQGQLLQKEEDAKSEWYSSQGSSGYVVGQYISNLNWHLLVETDTTGLDQKIQTQFMLEILIIVTIVALILLIVTSVIRKYNKKIVELTVAREQAHRTIFQEAAEQFYENVYEIDVTHNRAASEATQEYFESLGTPKNAPYDEGLRSIAQKQIKEEFRQGYLDTFSREHVLKAYENGVENLRYEFMITNDGVSYYWMRIMAHLFFWGEDESVRMLVYRQNIDREKRRELSLFEQMQKDSLTGLYNKASTQQHIQRILEERPGEPFAFFILDVDNFKRVNDRMGHKMGDTVLVEFAKALKEQFQRDDVVGRIGGDEFVAFSAVAGPVQAKEMGEALVTALGRELDSDAGVCRISTSIGIALAPEAGRDFETLYKNADKALYQTKERGKSGFTLFGR